MDGLSIFLIITAVSGLTVYGLHHHFRHNFMLDFVKANTLVVFSAGISLSLFAITETMMNYPHYYGNEASLAVFFHKVFIVTFYAQHPMLHILMFSALLACVFIAGWVWAFAYTINRMNRRRSSGLPTALN